MQKILDHLFYSILRVDLERGRVHVMHSVDQKNSVGIEREWDEYLNWYKQIVTGDALESLRSDKLLERYRLGQLSFSTEMPFQSVRGREWITMDVYMEEEDGVPYATVTIRKSTEDHLLKRIIELYVYSSCDYFIYLDAKHNSYAMFSHSMDGTPLPPAICDDYETEIVRYAMDYVYPEDREKVIREMRLQRVIEQLETKKVHSFSCGIIDEARGYTRKRLEYRYYDKENQMILLSRTDVTDAYMEEKEKQDKLEDALEQARTDALTGMLNRQGMEHEVKMCLDKDEKAALLFVDLDNFKNVNDTMGHIEGDHLLRETADTLKNQVRGSDRVARIGGDEFLVLLRGIRSMEEVKVCADRICRMVTELSPSSKLQISCSIGAVMTFEEGSSYEELVNMADQRAYSAKNRGKNQVCCE